MFQWGILRSKDYFGDDAHVFRPERWLEVDERGYAEMAAALEALFGYGRYKCLGRNVAFMQMSKALPEVSTETQSNDDTMTVLLAKVTVSSSSSDDMTSP